MYVKLAINNAKKSIKDYLIYFITITMCVSLFYAFTSLSSSSYELITEDSYNFEQLKKMLKYSTYVITALLAILVAYVSKYMIRRRQKEFATYILLGAEQKSIALMFFVEMLIVGILSVVCGIFDVTFDGKELKWQENQLLYRDNPIGEDKYKPVAFNSKVRFYLDNGKVIFEYLPTLWDISPDTLEKRLSKEDYPPYISKEQ